jgi:hypothetical protein
MMEKTAEFLEKWWPKPQGLVAILVAIVCSFGALAGALKLLEVELVWTLPFLGITMAGVGFIWYWHRRPPRAPSNKICVLICLNTADDTYAKRLKEDFIGPLRELIKASEIGRYMHVLELPRHLAEKVLDAEAAEVARVASKAHFLLWGNVRLRSVGDGQAHLVRLNGIVSHLAVDDTVQRSLSAEFTELLPSRLRIAEKDDALTFEFTSEWIDLVAKYIIGYAACVSGDIQTGEAFFRDVKRMLIGRDSNFAIYATLQARVPLRLSETAEYKANLALEKWTHGKDATQISAMNEALQQVELLDRKPYVLLKGIWTFLDTRDAKAALALVKSIKQEGDPTWHCNLAFLYGYSGDLKKAKQEYSKTTGRHLPAENIGQIESFICRVFEEEPQKVELLYCLALFNQFIKGDELACAAEFSRFLESSLDGRYQEARDVATAYLASVRSRDDEALVFATVGSGVNR